jgi:hypothetical protein
LGESPDSDQLKERHGIASEDAAKRDIASADRAAADVRPEDDMAQSVALHPDERNLR